MARSVNPTALKEAISSIPDHERIEDGLEKRFEEAWAVAFEAAEKLRTTCHAEEVRIIGSLLRRERFHEESDIDLLVSNFAMAEAFDSSEIMDSFYPWHIDIIPLRAVTEEKRKYLVSRSVVIEAGK